MVQNFSLAILIIFIFPNTMNAGDIDKNKFSLSDIPCSVIDFKSEDEDLLERKLRKIIEPYARAVVTNPPTKTRGYYHDEVKLASLNRVVLEFLEKAEEQVQNGNPWGGFVFGMSLHEYLLYNHHHKKYEQHLLQNKDKGYLKPSREMVGAMPEDLKISMIKALSYLYIIASFDNFVRKDTQQQVNMIEDKSLDKKHISWDPLMPKEWTDEAKENAETWKSHCGL